MLEGAVIAESLRVGTAQAHGRHLGIPDPQLDWTV